MSKLIFNFRELLILLTFVLTGLLVSPATASDIVIEDQTDDKQKGNLFLYIAKGEEEIDIGGAKPDCSIPFKVSPDAPETKSCSQLSNLKQTTKVTVKVGKEKCGSSFRVAPNENVYVTFIEQKKKRKCIASTVAPPPAKKIKVSVFTTVMKYIDENDSVDLYVQKKGKGHNPEFDKGYYCKARYHILGKETLTTICRGDVSKLQDGDELQVVAQFVDTGDVVLPTCPYFNYKFGQLINVSFVRSKQTQKPVCRVILK